MTTPLPSMQCEECGEPIELAVQAWFHAGRSHEHDARPRQPDNRLEGREAGLARAHNRLLNAILDVQESYTPDDVDDWNSLIADFEDAVRATERASV